MVEVGKDIGIGRLQFLVDRLQCGVLLSRGALDDENGPIVGGHQECEDSLVYHAEGGASVCHIIHHALNYDTPVVGMLACGFERDCLPFATHTVVVELMVQDGDGGGIDEGIKHILHVGIGDAFRLVIVDVAEQVGANHQGVHAENGFHLLLGQIDVGNIARRELPLRDAGVDNLLVGVYYLDHKGGVDEVGVYLLQIVDDMAQGVRVVPVVGVEDFHVFAIGYFQRGVYARAVVAVLLVDDSDDVGEA